MGRKGALPYLEEKEESIWELGINPISRRGRHIDILLDAQFLDSEDYE